MNAGNSAGIARLEADALAAEVKRLREHILDIDAHATPYGDLPGEPGYVGTYLVTAGALHRALGTVGHSAPSCEAEAQRDEALAQLQRLAAEFDQLKIISYDDCMTANPRRITVSLPDDVAAYLAEQSNASAEVTAAVRARMARTYTHEQFLADNAARGVVITPEGVERMRQRLDRLRTEAGQRRAARLAAEADAA